MKVTCWIQKTYRRERSQFPWVRSVPVAVDNITKAVWGHPVIHTLKTLQNNIYCKFKNLWRHFSRKFTFNGLTVLSSFPSSMSWISFLIAEIGRLWKWTAIARLEYFQILRRAKGILITYIWVHHSNDPTLLCFPTP